MFYDPIWDKQHEECGVLGIYDKHLARKAAASP